MGVVYRARSVTNDREVALKLLPPQFASDKTLSARFEREMEVLKSLKHPHIVHSYGGTCEGKRRFYAMELVEGGSLYQVIKKRGPLKWGPAVDYARQMCAGLGCAHQHGVVHRDVKPSNFLLTKEGKLKLSDFGLAFVSSATKLTAAGKTMGTYQYMAPEQIRGSKDISPQTDLYAMGCVIFEMLTGRPPFIGDSPAEILQQHLEATPPRVSEFALECPEPALADMIVAKLMEKSIKTRAPSAETVGEWLQSSVDAATVRAARTKPEVEARSLISVPKAIKRIRRLPKLDRRWLLPGCVVLLAIMLLWNILLLSRGGSQRDPSSGSRPGRCALD